MRIRTHHWLVAAALASALLAGSPRVGATAYDVVIASPGFALSDATLAFDLVDGGTPSNTVTLSKITSNGTQVSTSTSGSVSGTGPWIFSDTSFVSELLVSFGPLGTSMSFSFSTTDNPPDGGSFPDAFEFFVLSADATDFLITTDEPLGSNALFIVDIAGDSLHVYTPAESGYSIDVSVARAAPEPGSPALLAAGFVAFFLRPRFKKRFSAARLQQAEM